MKKKVLICGATGFIGRNVTETLARREDLELHAVRFNRPEYDCPGVTWHQADLRKLDDVEKLLAGMDVLIQAAATTSGSKDTINRPYIHVTDNAIMNSVLLRAAFDQEVKNFIFFSCTAMYQSSETPLIEEDFDASEEIYPRYFGVGWTKVYIEKISEFFASLGKTKHTVIRHSNIYGPYDKFDLERSHFFGATVTKVMSSQDGKIDVWGTGEEKRDILYVSDLVDLVEMAMDKQESPYELVNVGSGEAVSINNLVHKIIVGSGKDIEITHDLSQPTINTSMAMNCARAKAVFGWEAKVPLEEGIVKTIAWWKKNIAPTL